MVDETQEKSEIYQFGDCELDAARRELRLAGVAVTMQPKAFELLLYLVRNRHRAVDKDELQDALWPRSIVTETALTRCVMKARRAVNDDADRQAVIKTVHGHGYRFIADIRDEPAAETRQPAAGTPAPTSAESHRRRWIFGFAATAVVAIAALWWYPAPQPVSGDVRLAVLPVENATGEQDLDWTRTGLMALMNRMLEDQGVNVVSSSNVSDLAGDAPVEELLDADGPFRPALRSTTAATHFVGARLDTEGGLYRLSYRIEGGPRSERRAVVGSEPAALVRDVIATVTTLVTEGPPELDRMSSVSSDDFVNEAFARAMSLQYEGRYAEAQRLFQVVTEQEPDLFWPRYEYALAARNLRDFDTAERLFLALREETQQNGELAHEAAVHNSLGVMYMGQRRNGEALRAFEATASLAADIQSTHYKAVANVNLGLLAKNKGDLPLAYEHMQRAKTVYEQSDIRSLPGALLNNLSGVLILMGQLDEAEEYSLAAIENFRITGKRLYESYALSRLSSIYRRRGLYDEAEDAAVRAKVVREELGDRRGTASSLLTLADIAHDRGDLTRSLQFALQARDIATEIDDQDVMVDALSTMARSELALGKPRDAAARYAAAEAIARSHEDRMNAFGARYGLARAWIAMGDYDGALAIADQLITESVDAGRQREETAGHNLYAEVHMQRGEWDEAVAALELVVEIAHDIGDDGLATSAHARLGRCWIELGDIKKAGVYTRQVILKRPHDPDIDRLHARMSAAIGNWGDAAASLRGARAKAGESWTLEDEELIQYYQAEAEQAAAAE